MCSSDLLARSDVVSVHCPRDTTTMRMFDAKAFARMKRGAIFVNFNYRVGIMGYLAHPALTAEQGGHSGNYGYLDQNAALKWIRDNIAAGRPIRIQGLSDQTGGPAFAVCAGLIGHALAPQEAPRHTASAAPSANGWMGRFGLWLRENL